MRTTDVPTTLTDDASQVASLAMEDEGGPPIKTRT
jgi:hypothetical protein